MGGMQVHLRGLGHYLELVVNGLMGLNRVVWVREAWAS